MRLQLDAPAIRALISNNPEAILELRMGVMKEAAKHWKVTLDSTVNEVFDRLRKEVQIYAQTEVTKYFGELRNGYTPWKPLPSVVAMLQEQVKESAKAATKELTDKTRELIDEAVIKANLQIEKMVEERIKAWTDAVPGFIDKKLKVIVNEYVDKAIANELALFRALSDKDKVSS